MTQTVCDAGPLTHLWQIDQWQVFSAIHIAASVAAEVRRHVQIEQMKSLAGHTVIVHEVPPHELQSLCREIPSAQSLQQADIATIVLATRLKPDLILTDDLKLRQIWEIENYTPMGSVGILMFARKAGLLTTRTLDRAIDRLFVPSTLYLNPQFKSYARRLIAEMTVSLPE
ncbi:MAG: hypothetical protein U1F76_13080 [Candidatus Competibacteraceae bacterium]